MSETAPCIEEKYLAATNTSSLKIGKMAERTQADVIFAAGMDKGNQLGHALIYLRSQWDRCDKPRKRTPADIAKRAAEIPDKKGRPDLKRAGTEALVWHAGALRQCAAALTGRNQVLGLLQEWAASCGVDPDLLSPAIFHWLAPACPVCEGRGKRPTVFGQEVSKQSCYHCRGEGIWPRPLGAHQVHDHMKACLGRAKGGTGRALYG